MLILLLFIKKKVAKSFFIFEKYRTNENAFTDIY